MMVQHRSQYQDIFAEGKFYFKITNVIPAKDANSIGFVSTVLALLTTSAGILASECVVESG